MRRALRDLLSTLRLPDRGVTLVTTDRWTLAEELWSFGEDSLYPVALGGWSSSEGSAKPPKNARKRAHVEALTSRANSY